MSATESDSEVFEVDYILDQRKRGRVTEYLIRWKGYGDEEDSWEPLKNIREAKDALERFQKEGKPAPVKRRSQTKTKTTKKEGADAVTTTTRTMKTTIITSGSLGVESSPDSSPVMSRRLRHLQDETKERLSQSLRTMTPQKKATVSKRKWSLNPCSWVSCSWMQGCSMKSCLRVTREDIPIVILITCLLVIMGTFVYEAQMKA